jgi:hypothetical protein
MVGARPTHGRHALDTQRVVKWLVWDAIWVSFCAKFSHGPKMKFDHLGLLFISYLGCQAIRVMDQRVISPQDSSVNALKIVMETCFRRSKPGQTEPNFLYALPHRVSSSFYFWNNSSCSTNFGEREMSTIIATEIQT